MNTDFLESLLLDIYSPYKRIDSKVKKLILQKVEEFEQANKANKVLALHDDSNISFLEVIDRACISNTDIWKPIKQVSNLNDSSLKLVQHLGEEEYIEWTHNFLVLCEGIWAVLNDSYRNYFSESNLMSANLIFSEPEGTEQEAKFDFSASTKSFGILVSLMNNTEFKYFRKRKDRDVREKERLYLRRGDAIIAGPNFCFANTSYKDGNVYLHLCYNKSVDDHLYEPIYNAIEDKSLYNNPLMLYNEERRKRRIFLANFIQANKAHKASPMSSNIDASGEEALTTSEDKSFKPEDAEFHVNQEQIFRFTSGPQHLIPSFIDPKTLSEAPPSSLAPTLPHPLHETSTDPSTMSFSNCSSSSSASDPTPSTNLEAPTNTASTAVEAPTIMSASSSSMRINDFDYLRMFEGVDVDTDIDQISKNKSTNVLSITYSLLKGPKVTFSIPLYFSNTKKYLSLVYDHKKGLTCRGDIKDCKSFFGFASRTTQVFTKYKLSEKVIGDMLIFLLDFTFHPTLGVTFDLPAFLNVVTKDCEAYEMFEVLKARLSSRGLMTQAHRETSDKLVCNIPYRYNFTGIELTGGSAEELFLFVHVTYADRSLKIRFVCDIRAPIVHINIGRWDLDHFMDDNNKAFLVSNSEEMYGNSIVYFIKEFLNTGNGWIPKLTRYYKGRVKITRFNLILLGDKDVLPKVKTTLESDNINPLNYRVGFNLTY
jgi:hypothetical protein